jgi:PAS domain S-box-containing protein
MIKTLLFVEDDLVDRLVLEKEINKTKEFNCFSAGSWEEATEVLRTKKVDVIVTDHNLGDGKGINFIDTYPDIPVVIITGMNDLELAVHAMKIGAYDFVVKDFDRHYLNIVPISCLQAIKRKEQELFLSKLTQAVEQNPSLILITDAKGYIEYTNPKFIDITGYTTEDIIGKSIDILKSDHHDQAFYDNIDKTLSSGTKWTGELYSKTMSGTYFWEFASIAPIMNNSGEITHFVKVSENITELKLATQELLKTEKLQSILEMAGAVCHELNQPLQVISGYIELITDTVNEDILLRKAFTNIVANINRIADITEKLSKITEYKTVQYLDDVNIIDIYNQPE